MVEHRDRLLALGHEGHVHPDYDAFVRGEKQDILKRFYAGEAADVKKENDYIRAHYAFVVWSDAVLALNHDKNGISGYIGGNTLMELGFAHFHRKKIFLLNPIPQMQYTDEIVACQPTVINGDVGSISMAFSNTPPQPSPYTRGGRKGGMRVYVLGSTKFVHDMVATTEALQELGVDAWIHPDYIEYVETPHHDHYERMMKGEQALVKIENDYIRQHYNGILASDAVLFVNNEKNGVKNYIGGNVLMEMGFAYVNNKKIFLKNGMPENLPYLDEIIAMDPVCLNGDISLLA